MAGFISHLDLSYHCLNGRHVPEQVVLNQTYLYSYSYCPIRILGTGWAILKTQRWQDAITQERRHRLSCGFAR